MVKRNHEGGTEMNDDWETMTSAPQAFLQKEHWIGSLKRYGLAPVVISGWVTLDPSLPLCGPQFLHV